MPLEDIEGPGKYIDALNPNWPVGATDDIAEGDNHIRGTKNTVQNSFPNINGPVNASDEELSHCAGVTSAIQTQLNGKSDDSHNHDGVYSLLSHSHSQYAPTNHSHSEYAQNSHTHPEYAPVDHTHNDYAPISHNHPDYDAYEPRIAALEADSGGGGGATSIFWDNSDLPNVYEWRKSTEPNKMFGVTILNSFPNSLVTVNLSGPQNINQDLGYTNSQGNLRGNNRAVDIINLLTGTYTATYRVGGNIIGTLTIIIYA